MTEENNLVPEEQQSLEVPQIVETEPVQETRPRVDLQPITTLVQAVKQEISKVIVGQEEVVDLLLASIFIGGHVLIEGVPGVAKTLTARMIARSIKADFSRIQFTPDLMPSDVVGTTVFNMKDSNFTFNAGPIFANIVLIDEINRAPAKTQAALFEVMEEQQVTVDGTTYPMSQPFFVVATQNPIEQEGTYRLPEAQLDRFLFKINMQYPNQEEETAILLRYRNDFHTRTTETVQAIATPTAIAECTKLVEQIYISDELIAYITELIQRTRNHPDLYLGASPRAALAILKAAKANAALQERDFVTPDDIQTVAYPVLNHRIILTPEREMEGYTAQSVINGIIKQIEVPR
ncbi:MAG: MoxR family ATPase [Bacteroidota bacterium]